MRPLSYVLLLSDPFADFVESVGHYYANAEKPIGGLEAAGGKVTLGSWLTNLLCGLAVGRISCGRVKRIDTHPILYWLIATDWRKILGHGGYIYVGTLVVWLWLEVKRYNRKN